MPGSLREERPHGCSCTIIAPSRAEVAALLLLLAHRVMRARARALRHRWFADRDSARSADDARNRRTCAALGTVCAGCAFRFGGMTVEATAHFDATAATAATAAAAATGDGDAARGWLLFMKLLCGDRDRGHFVEPVGNVLASQLDFSAPRPPADHRQAAQQHHNRREHADDEDGDGVATGAVQRARRPLRGRRWRVRGRRRWRQW